MQALVNQTSRAVALPEPRTRITVRPATLDDLSFIDSLQKLHYKMVGYMWTKMLEGKIAAGHVLIAEERSEVRDQKSEKDRDQMSEFRDQQLTSDLRPLTSVPVGYCIGTDRYFKRDDVGIIYQMNVVPDRQRGLIGATLVKAMFDRAAWGCKLFCCWCAQDIAANSFWESLGFVPLAFRAGSRTKRRVHIFWQRRIRAADTTTPYWFPSQTTGGSIREDRIVLPIPPGMHWRDAKPIVLPGTDQLPVASGELPDSTPKAPRRPKKAMAIRPVNATSGGLWFVPAKPVEPQVKPKRASPESGRREPKPKVKNDPRLVAAARELRDRWMEEVNAGRYLPQAQAKYEVSRALPAPNPTRTALALPMAA